MRAQLFPLLWQQSTHQSCQSLSRSVRWAVQDRACRFTRQSVFGVAPGLFPDHTTWALKALIVRRNGNRSLPEARACPCYPGNPLICGRWCFRRCSRPTLISQHEAPQEAFCLFARSLQEWGHLSAAAKRPRSITLMSWIWNDPQVHCLSGFPLFSGSLLSSWALILLLEAWESCTLSSNLHTWFKCCERSSALLESHPAWRSLLPRI